MQNSISIVTVCYNAENNIRETIESVLNQTYSNFQYIIIDGKSNDRTVDICNEYITLFSAKHIRFDIYSEPDNGIYDAMNKAKKYATNDWILFLNSGDLLFSNDTLSKAFSENTVIKNDVVYGDTVLHYKQYYKFNKALDASLLMEKMPFCHQSVFVRRELIEKYPFDTNYKICADYNLFLTLFIRKYRFKHINIPIAIYDLSGISEKLYKVEFKEMDMIQDHFNLSKDKRIRNDFHMKTVFFIALRSIYRRAFPKIYFSRRREWFADKDEVVDVR